jgi:hypothetical protein
MGGSLFIIRDESAGFFNNLDIPYMKSLTVKLLNQGLTVFRESFFCQKGGIF